jgi:hypothetical protein
MSSPQFYTYEEWIALHPEILEVQKCVECNGIGTIKCDECGQDRECSKCGGEGGIAEAKEEYRRQLEYDKRLWNKTMSTIKPEDRL